MINKSAKYLTEYSVDGWIELITTKFSDLSFKSMVSDITNILDITSKNEIKKIEEASLIIFGEKIGIHSFEDACDKLGKSSVMPEFLGLDDDLVTKFIAEYKLIMIIKALNDGWYPNWIETSEYKYFNYFNTSHGFSSWPVDSDNTNTSVPSALYLKSEDLARYCGRRFIHLYEEYYK